MAVSSLGQGPFAIAANYGASPGGGWMTDPDVSAYTNAQRYAADQNTKQAQIAADASRYPATLKQQRFDTIFPWLQGQLGSLSSGGGLATAGGQSGPSPEITVGGVWNPQQTQQQVNSARAKNDQTAQTTMRGQQQQLSAQGFGANSPLLQSLYGQTQANNLATNTSNEREIRNNAAQQNAQNLLSTQSARENQFANRQNEDIERRKPVWQTFNNLIGSLVGLAG